ncbi:MAG: chromosomal replication initiator protein DnaA, partial [Rhodocyclaceae bacterium]|nr:chromosomal replication initiator protein DnaA [Rhodocyclaceae bacterium]
MSELWSHCLSCLEHELPQQQVDTWLRVLSADADADDAQRLRLLAPNRRVLNWVQKSYLPRIQ